MSLEAALAENTAAIKEMCALLKEANDGRAAAVEGIKDAVGAKQGRAPGAKDKKAKDTPAPAAETPAAPKPPTVDEFRTKAGGWLNESADLKPARKAFVKSITEHFGVTQLTEISADEFPKILDWMDRFAKGEKINFSEGEDEQPAAEEEEEDDLV